jgi:hypothetical protein
MNFDSLVEMCGIYRFYDLEILKEIDIEHKNQKNFLKE